MAACMETPPERAVLAEGGRSYLGDCLFCNCAWPALAGVQPLIHREAAAVRLEPLYEEVIDGGKVVVALVLQGLGREQALESTSEQAGAFLQGTRDVRGHSEKGN